MANFATTTSSNVQHIAQPRAAWYSGMSDTDLCGARVQVSERVAGTAPGYTQPVGTCRRCAAALGQSVRAITAP